MSGAGETIVLKPSRKRQALLIVGAIVLVGASASMLAGSQGFNRVIGWVAVIFFGLAGIVVAVQLVTNNYLMLTSDGFTVRGMGRQYTTRWADVESFTTMRPLSIYPVRKLVVYNFSPGYRRLPGVRRMGRAISGYEAGLPDTYGMKADDLAALMNRWRVLSG